MNLSSECRTSDILWLREPLSPEQLLSPNLVFDCQDVRTVWKAESDMMREDMDQYDTETGAAAAEEITDDDGVTVQMVQQHN